MRIHKNSLTDRLLNRWFKDLGGGTINETCPICLDCCKKENICCPTCLNVYHRDCLIKNVVNTGKNICPVCQSLIISDVVGYIVKDDILNIPVSV